MTLRNIRLYHHYIKEEDKLKKTNQIEKCRDYANMFFDCLNKDLTLDIIDVPSKCQEQYYMLNKCIKTIS